MNNTDELLFKFKEHLKVLNRSRATVQLYMAGVSAFVNAIDQGDMRSVTKNLIEEYIAGLYERKNTNGKPYSIGTICVKVRSIKRFFEFLEKTNIIFINPAEYIREPKNEKRLVEKALTNDEVKKILDQPNLGTRMGIRDRALLEVLYSTGIRREEVKNLTIYDADLTEKTLRVNKGKGKKDRVVPLGKHAVKFLREYIAKVRPHYTRKNRSNRSLFVDIYGKPLSPQMVGVLVKTYARAAKIKKQVTPHTFRHTVATLLLKNGANIVEVQKFMGHANIRTTQRYIHALGLNIKKVHQKTHPREKDKQKRKTIKPNIERIL